MIKLLFRLGFFLLVGVLIYNYFLGTPEEKETSKTIFREARDLGKASWALLKTEKAKLDQGKYDTALDRIETLIGQLKERARSGKDRETLEQLAELEQQRRTLQGRMEALNAQKATAAGIAAKRSISLEEKQLKSDLRQLLDDTETVMKYME